MEWRVPGLTFLWYTESQKIKKPNKLKVWGSKESKVIKQVSIYIYSGTCLIRHTKGPGKCVGFYRMLEYSSFIYVNRNTLGSYIFVGCHRMSENSGVGLHRSYCIVKYICVIPVNIIIRLRQSEIEKRDKIQFLLLPLYISYCLVYWCLIPQRNGIYQESGLSIWYKSSDDEWDRHNRYYHSETGKTDVTVFISNVKMSLIS